MKRKMKFVGIAIAGLLGIGVFGWVVMLLWNWLVPAVFAGHTITFWQALGLLVLAKILFGGFRGGPGPGRHWRRRMKERWANMTPEERETFLRGMERRCGRGMPPETAGPSQA